MDLHGPNDRMPAIIPLDFRVDYQPQPDGSMKEIEVVEYTRKGSQGATTPARIEHLQRMRDGRQDPVWLAIKPYYDNWKAGKGAPVNGTPLEAWPGATPQLVKALLPFHIKSVEDLAEIEEGPLNKCGVPGIRGMKANAQAFIEAQKNTAAVAGEVAALRAEKETMAAEIAELKELVASLAKDEPKRPVGRPRKVA